MSISWYNISSSGHMPCLAACGTKGLYRIYQTSNGHTLYRKTGKDWLVVQSFHSSASAKSYVERSEL